MEKHEFPYMKGRLVAANWERIVASGEPWEDPDFPHGPACLFIDGKGPHESNKHKESKKKWVEGLHWQRASEYYGKEGFQIFDGVDPTDAVMGGCNNCYAFAALSGIAEAH